MRLLVVIGPPAVGKMTVGREIAARSAYRLHHNHAVMEPLLEVFDYGTPSFRTLLDEFRLRVIQEAAASDTSLVLTFVWGLELVEDTELVQRWIDVWEQAGGDVAFVELYAALPTRLERNHTELRLVHKASKRDVEWSDGNVRELETYVMNTGSGPTPGEALLRRHPHLRLDNTDLSAAEVAERVLAWLEDLAAGHRRGG